jgi:hypothetical protein
VQIGHRCPNIFNAIIAIVSFTSQAQSSEELGLYENLSQEGGGSDLRGRRAREGGAQITSRQHPIGSIQLQFRTKRASSESVTPRGLR